MTHHIAQLLVTELTVLRENGAVDSDLHLCDRCEAGTTDFLVVLKRRKTGGPCDRCGKSERDCEEAS